MKVTVLKTNGRSESAEVSTFRDIEKIVGGYYEIIQVTLDDGHPVDCAINEMGDLLPRNPHLQLFYANQPIPEHAIVIGTPKSYICGDIVMLPSDWTDQLSEDNA